MWVKPKGNSGNELYDHVTDITTGILDRSIAKHFATRHKYKVDTLKFMALARIILCQEEATLIASSYKWNLDGFTN